MVAEVVNVLEQSCAKAGPDEVWEHRHGGLLLTAAFASKGKRVNACVSQ
jgi:hypothetical protein